MSEEWGTPVSKEKIIARRNRLIEHQKIGELRFTPLYEIINENILDINYMIYEIERLNNIIDELEKECKRVIGNGVMIDISAEGDNSKMVTITCYEAILDKLKELKEGNKDE